HRLEVRRLELGEGLVAQDAGVVDDDVDAAEVVDRGLDDRPAALGRGDRVVVGRGLTAGLADLLHGLVGHARARARAVGLPAEIVHDHLAAARGELQGVGLAEAAAGAGDDGHLAVEADVAHGGPFRSGVWIDRVEAGRFYGNPRAGASARAPGPGSVGGRA